MQQRAIPIGTLFGIPVTLDYSWFLIFVLLTWTLAVGYFPVAYPEWSPVSYWAMGALTSIMLFVSVLLHEFGHSLVARHYKVPVRRITLMVFGGVSEMEHDPDNAKAEFWIAFAGPAVSLALAALFAALQPLVASSQFLLAEARYLAYINAILGIFNLIPGFPLDGGNVLRAILWGRTGDLHRATLLAANVGRIFAYLFIFAGVWILLAGDIVDGLWTAFIGWFLESAATAQVQRERIQDLLSGHPVFQAMNRHFATVPVNIPLQQLVDTHILAGGKRAFVVMAGDRAVGLLTLHQIKTVSREKWPVTTVAQVLSSLPS